MGRVYSVVFLIAISLSLASPRSWAQLRTTTTPPPGSASAPASTSSQASHAPPIPADAPLISKQTRYQIIHDFETQIVYSRTAFPMGNKGLILKDGAVTPNGQQLQQLLALWGPSIKPGDPAVISFIRIKDDHIHFDLNGGPIHRKKWYQRVQISGSGGTPVPLSNDQEVQNPHGSYLDVYFDKHVPEMSAAQLRDLLYPVLDFKAHNKEEAYLDTVPPMVKQAIQEHRVLVGMNTEMVLHAVGKPARKVREKDGDTEYEEWIYGQAPQDVDFVRLVGDEVVRIETMKVGGKKIVRTEKEVILPKNDKEEQEAKKQEEQVRPANAPSLRRPGEDQENVPKPSDGSSPVPPAVPQPPPTPPNGDSPGPN